MGITLQGKQINQTYDGLIKTTDNEPLTSEKQLTDGLGNNIPLYVSQSGIKFTGIVNYTSQTAVGAPWALSSALTTLEGEVDTNTSNISTLQSDVTGLDSQVSTNTSNISTNTTDITNLQNGVSTISSDVSDLQSGVGNVIGLEGLTGNLSFSGVNIDISTSGTDTIVLSASTGGGGTGAVDDVNSITGSVNLVSSDLDFLTITESGQDINFDVLPQRTILQDVKNATSGTLVKGTPLHITGSTGNEAEVIPADASTGLSAHLVLNENLIAGASGKAVAVGFINNVSISDTTNFQPGTEVYLASGGGFTHIKPTGTNIVQFLGVVIKASTTSGAGTISGLLQNMGIENQLPNLANGYLWLGNGSGVPQETQRITINNLPTITNEHVWKGGAGGTPVAVNQNTLSVYGSVYSDNAVDVKVDSITSGTYRLIVGDTGVTAGDYTRLKTSVVDELTYNTAGNILSSGALSVTNNVTAGGTLIGTTLDISGNADIDGTLTLGSIGNVEGEINDLNTFVNNFEQFSPIVNETTTITIDDASYSTYLGKTIIITSATAVDVELDFTSAPVSGDEMYFVQGGVGAIGIINYGGSVFSSQGTSPTSRAQYSGMVYKYVGSGNWLVMGDIA